MDPSPFVLVCALCGRQRELPSSPAELASDGWLYCNDGRACKSVKFAVRLRIPPRKTEPHP